MTTAAAARPARVRLGPWPHERDTVHLVLLDHQMVPTGDELDGWMAQAAAGGGRTIRTGALFPAATPAFLDADFRVVDTLTLLARQLPAGERLADVGVSTRRLRRTQLEPAAAIDQRSFGASGPSGSWTNDARALADIMDATPHHRSRAVVVDHTMAAFAISGRAGRIGYIQRLAVEPAMRRRGLGRDLVVDALRWMQRRHVAEVLVNTGADNTPALALYHALGFVDRPEPLLILERDLAGR